MANKRTFVWCEKEVRRGGFCEEWKLWVLNSTQGSLRGLYYAVRGKRHIKEKIEYRAFKAQKRAEDKMRRFFITMRDGTKKECDDLQVWNGFLVLLRQLTKTRDKKTGFWPFERVKEETYYAFEPMEYVQKDDVLKITR